MGVLYVSFGSKVGPRTFGCVAMGSAMLFTLRSKLLLYYVGSGVDRVLFCCCSPFSPCSFQYGSLASR